MIFFKLIIFFFTGGPSPVPINLTTPLHVRNMILLLNLDFGGWGWSCDVQSGCGTLPVFSEYQGQPASASSSPPSSAELKRVRLIAGRVRMVAVTYDSRRD